MHFSVDTNFLLQCRQPSDLDWSLVTGDGSVHLYVVREVQKEIDRHKSGGNTRRADRARKCSALLRSILRSPDAVLRLRENAPAVTLQLAPRPSADRVPHHALDLNESDDRIIDQTLALRDSSEGLAVSLLTHDTNPMVTAQLVGLAFEEIPDAWLLPPEPNEASKELGELKRRVSSLEKRSPQITIVDRTPRTTTDLRLQIKRTVYSALTKVQVDSVRDEIERRTPHVTDFSEPPAAGAARTLSIYQVHVGATVWTPPSNPAIRRYDADYDTWRQKTSEALSTFHVRLNEIDRTADILFEIGNEGERPAESLLVDFKGLGGILLTPYDKRPTQPPLFERPPAAPKGTRRSALLRNTAYLAGLMDAPPSLPRIHSPALESLIGNKERDKHGFYYEKRHRTPSAEWRLTCEDFRHKLSPENFDWTVSADAEIGSVVRGAVRCIVSAANLDEPQELTVQVELATAQGDTLEKAMQAVGQ